MDLRYCSNIPSNITRIFPNLRSLDVRHTDVCVKDQSDVSIKQSETCLVRYTKEDNNGKPEERREEHITIPILIGVGMSLLVGVIAVIVCLIHKRIRYNTVYIRQMPIMDIELDSPAVLPANNEELLLYPSEDDEANPR